MKKSRRVILLCLLIFLCGLTTVCALEGDMVEEFAYLSGQTSQAMALSSQELGSLVERSERLLEDSSRLKMPEKKIMRKKIVKLRDLFLFVLHTREEQKGHRPSE